MLRDNHRIGWRGQAAMAAALALGLLAGGCAPHGVFGGPGEPAAADPSAAPSFTGFLSGSSAKRPQGVAGAPANLNCPPVQIREGASTLTIGPRGENATMAL